MRATVNAAAKRTPSGIFARLEFARADSRLGEIDMRVTVNAAAKRTPSGIFARLDPREQIPVWARST